MKRILLIAIIAILPFAGFSQSIFEKYESNNKVGFINISPKMIELAADIGKNTNDPDARNLADLAKSIKTFKVMTTEDTDISEDIHSWVNRHLKNSSLEELMRVRDGDTNVKAYIREGRDENHISELLMFVTGIGKANVNINGTELETVLVSLTGDIDLRKIGELTDKMNLPGSKQLKKATKH
ncbi:DUF4252 domain-containing protein [Flavobacteriaceae bacterium R38]|nr:DUF4252 domain-containing protein [Flavobacteriaceae bacterium R38]